MDGRKNRFIIFPDEYEENSILNQEKKEQSELSEKIVQTNDSENSTNMVPSSTGVSLEDQYIQVNPSKIDENDQSSVPVLNIPGVSSTFNGTSEMPIEEVNSSMEPVDLASLDKVEENPIDPDSAGSLEQTSSTIVDRNISDDSKIESVPSEQSDLGDLGVIKRDSEGRIIFDAPDDDGNINDVGEGTFVVEGSADDSTAFESVSLPDQVPLEQALNKEKQEPIHDESSSVSQDFSTLESVSPSNELTSAKSREFQTSRNLQDMINKILKIDNLNPVEVEFADKNIPSSTVQTEEVQKQQETSEIQLRQEIHEIVQDKPDIVVFKSDLLEKLRVYSEEHNKVSMLVRYGEDYCSKDFVTNPAIGREEEIKQLILTLLTPEKSAILIGKPGIGKTSIVEGLAYRLQRNLVPEALQGFAIVNIKTPSLLGTLPTGETRLQTLVDELKTLDHVILFIDEIHMLIGATNDSAMDFANMFKEGLGRGQIKIIGATTTEEYERYILRDKAFVRRFQSIEVLEPSREHTIKILMGTLPKIEKETGAKMKYTTFIQSEIMAFITDITSEYKRVYGIGSRYPDICLTLLKESFSQCIFDNRDRVTIFDVRDAIQNSKNIYPDVIRKELPKFDEKFKKIIDEERADDASIDRL